MGMSFQQERQSYVNLYNLEELAKDKRIGGAEYRVLHFLLARMNYDEAVQISQSDIGNILDMKQPCVARALKVLKEAGIIRSEGKPGQTATYTLNPYYGSRGKASNVIQMQKKWDDNAE